MIGVVVPVLDGAAYLGEALDSIRGQTAGTPELVVVDDGSTDASVAIARERGARVLTTPSPRSGAAVARRVGAAALATPLLAFLDADDRWVPDKLARQLAALAAEPHADAALGGVRNFLSPDCADELRSRVALPPDQAVAAAFGALLIRRAAFAALDGDHAGPGEVPEFFRRARERLGFAHVDGVVYERRVHGANTSVRDRAELHAGYLRVARAAILAQRERPA